MGDLILSLAEAASALEATADTIVNPSIDEFYALYPALREKHGPKGMERCREDCFYHVEFLVAAMRANNPKLFVEYIRWVRVLLGARNASDNLMNMLELIGQRIRTTQDNAIWNHVRSILDPGLEALQADRSEHELVIMPPPNALMRAYLGAILKGNRVLATKLVMDAVKAGMSVRDVYLDVFQAALYEVGRQWEIGQVSVAQEHLATAITQTVLATLYNEVPMPVARKESAVVACLSGNTHQLGPRILADFLQMAGFDAYFLGADTPETSLLAMIDDIKPGIIGLPATLPRHIEPVRQMIGVLRSEFVSYQPTIMVGGIAFNLVENLWREAHADVWGYDAGQAIDNLVGSW